MPVVTGAVAIGRMIWPVSLYHSLVKTFIVQEK